MKSRERHQIVENFYRHSVSPEIARRDAEGMENTMSAGETWMLFRAFTQQHETSAE